MKTRSCLHVVLLLVLSIGIDLYAQQSDADRKLFEELKARSGNGDAQSQFTLGAVFYFGDLGLAKDEVEAVKWYRKAAEQNLASAQYNLGNCYREGRGVPKDAVEAVGWYRKAAEQNCASAQFNLGYCYHDGHGVAKDDAEAVK